MIVVDGPVPQAVNTNEKNYTMGKLARRQVYVEDSITRYPAELEEANWAETGLAMPPTPKMIAR